MNKADLIDKIAAGSRINKTQAAAAIDTLVDSVTGALRKGDRVALVGFGLAAEGGDVVLVAVEPLAAGDDLHATEEQVE